MQQKYEHSEFIKCNKGFIEKKCWRNASLIFIWVIFKFIHVQQTRDVGPILAYGWSSIANGEPTGAAYILVFIFYFHIKYHLFNVSKINCDINQQYLKRVDLHFVKSE